MRFTKMQGLGNDYLYVYGPVPEQIREICTTLSDRHFGVGSDGMIFISPSDIADFKMRIFNADGSEAKMCGNGIRCVGKYVYDKGYTDQKNLTVETLSGIKTLRLDVAKGAVKKVAVDMGEAIVSQDIKRSLCGKHLICTPVSVGNPHAVLFFDKEEALAPEILGPVIEQTFPGGVNVEFVQVLSPSELHMRVWERGSGVTMACGTGACASAAASVSKGFCPFDSPIRVHLDGGILEIKVSREMKVIMTGPAETVFEGEVRVC